MTYVRYSIPTRPAPNTAPHPNRFKVLTNRVALAKLLFRELIQYRGNLDTVLSRPCVYGVFSSPLGAFMARDELCVGCLRCTVQHPNVVEILPNPERLNIGDSYIDPDLVETLLYEAASGRIPVRGAGYGGSFGGTGWDTIWTDMSEIVRPTRDGIHGREFISTSVLIGWTPLVQEFESHSSLAESSRPLIELPIPVLFDRLPVDKQSAYAATTAAASTLATLAIVPADRWDEELLQSESTVPLVDPEDLGRLAARDRFFRMIELDGWNQTAYSQLTSAFPETVVAVRLDVDADLSEPLESGVEVFHLTADYHGQTNSGFTLDAIRAAHEGLIVRGIREQVTLIGSGGIAAAEHVPKAIIAGLDVVAIETAAMIAMQAQFHNEVHTASDSQIEMPHTDPAWAAQRLVNLMGSWRDQLLEILGAMGLREVRRLRGEIGRAMFQADMEREAFAGIEGYE
ncbi:MAG: glutamate synthase-related protein [Anaerolineales bacterium]